MAFNNALLTTISPNGKKSGRKNKGAGKITTFSLSDLFHRQPAQGSATRIVPNSFETSPTIKEVIPRAKPWARSSSLSIPSPTIPGFPALDGLKREECGVNDNVSLIADIGPSSALSTSHRQDLVAMKQKQTLPREPPPIPSPPPSKKAPSSGSKGKKASKDKGLIADFIPAYARDANGASSGNITDLIEPKEREHVHCGVTDWDNEVWPSLDEVDPLPSRLKPALPSQPPSIPPPPSKDKRKDTPNRKEKSKAAPKQVGPNLPLPLHSDPYDYWPFEDDDEELAKEKRQPIPLHMRSTLPTGPPSIAPPPTSSKSKPQGQQRKTQKGKKDQPDLAPSSVPEYHSDSKVRQYHEPPSLPQSLGDDLLKAEWVRGPPSFPSLPPSLRQVLPKEPPPSPLPPSLKKNHKNKAEKQTHKKPEFGTQRDLALFIPGFTANNPRSTELKFGSFHEPSPRSANARHGSFRSLTLPLINEEEALLPPAVNVPQRLQPVLPSQPPSTPPPPSLKSHNPRSSKRSKKRSGAKPGPNEVLCTPISANLSETASSSSPTSSLAPFSLTFEDDAEWSTPPSSASDFPARLRPVLPSGPPPIPEPPTPRTKPKSARRRNSSSSASHPLSPFIPAYTDDIYSTPSLDFYELEDVLDDLTGLERSWYLSPPSPFSDEDTLVASPPSWPDVAPRSRVLPDQPPPIPPPPMSPLRPGKQSRRRRSSASSHPLASFIPAYAKEGEREEPSDILPSPSDGLSGYVYEERDRLRKLRRDYLERTKELRELQEERQRTPKKSGKVGIAVGAHWHVRWEKAKTSIYNAARAYVKGTRLVEYSGFVTFDFHGVMAEEAQYIALEILEEEYSSCEARNIPFQPLKLVTGRGVHSANKVPKVKPAVEDALSDEGWQYEDYEGYFIVLGRVTDNISPITVLETSVQGSTPEDLADAEIFDLDYISTGYLAEVTI